MQERSKPITGENRRFIGFWRHLSFLLVLLGIFISGCIIARVSIPYLQMGEEIHPEQWQVGSSTKEEVLERSTPNVILTDQNKFLYFWLESDSGIRIETFQGGGTTRTWDKYLGLVGFNEKSVVESLWSGEQPAHQYSLEALVYGQTVADRINAKDIEHPRSFLLMRVIIDIDGRRLEKPLDYFFIKGLGFRTFREFKTIKPKRIKWRFTEAGWVVLEAVPGELRYISFSRRYWVPKNSGDLNKPVMADKPEKVQLPANFLPWKISVPEETYIYAGTFLFSNREKGSREVHCDEPRDESDLALDVIRKQFSEDIDMAVSLAEKHSKPFVLRIPSAYK